MQLAAAVHIAECVWCNWRQGKKAKRQEAKLNGLNVKEIGLNVLFCNQMKLKKTFGELNTRDYWMSFDRNLR